MNEAISYIFRRMHTSECAVKCIRKTLRKQARVNRSIATFTLAIFVYTVIMETHRHEQDKKIDDLSNEIKELKRMRGE